MITELLPSAPVLNPWPLLGLQPGLFLLVTVPESRDAAASNKARCDLNHTITAKLRLVRD
jgi:hypothetical protein